MHGDILSTFNCHLNCTSAGEHVPEAEHAVRVIKERIRCIITTWPFKSVPLIFKINLIKFVIFWLNAIPKDNAVLPNVCSKAVVTVQFPDFNKHCLLGFGDYVHVHNPRTITNTMAPRTSSAIAMGPTSSIQGSQRFFCLQTKRILIRRQLTKLPIPDFVIQQIHVISMKERGRLSKKQKKAANEAPSEYHISHGTGVDTSSPVTVTVDSDTSDPTAVEPSPIQPPDISHPDPANQLPSPEHPTLSPKLHANDDLGTDDPSTIEPSVDEDTNDCNNRGADDIDANITLSHNNQNSSPDDVNQQLTPHTP